VDGWSFMMGGASQLYGWSFTAIWEELYNNFCGALHQYRWSFTAI